MREKNTYSEEDQKDAGIVANLVTAMCVRAYGIEKIHRGISVVTRTGDYSDVKIIDGEGNEIPWNEASRITNSEMKELMKRTANRLYTYFLQRFDPRFERAVKAYMPWTREWDKPEIDQGIDCRISQEENFRRFREKGIENETG